MPYRSLTRCGLVSATLAVAGCAKGGAAGADAGPDALACGDMCDADDDGVFDALDECPDTPRGEEVNSVGCADSEVSPTLEPAFPPFGLTWTPTGDLGRVGGLTWTYVGIDRADLFHIYWIICDDPATPCGVSLDGPIDAANENWQFDPVASNLPGGRSVFTNTTTIVLADTSTVSLSGRLTVTIVDGGAVPFAFAAVADLGVVTRSGTHGAEIVGTAFTVTALVEVQDATAVWTPYLDYYDAAPTGDPGGATAVSFGGSFYSE